MNLDFTTLARSGVVALGVLGLWTLPSAAAPAGMAGSADVAAPSEMALRPLLVQSTEPDMRGGSPDGFWRGQWEERDWVRRKKLRRQHWRNWDNDWRPRRHYRPRSGIYFNFDLTPRPRYVYPKRVYRSSGLSQSHVNWCYNRYQSYRAWDNTFQPYHGPRQQCWSPYS